MTPDKPDPPCAKQDHWKVQPHIVDVAKLTQPAADKPEQPGDAGADVLREAVRLWLRFDNEVEPPKEAASWAEHVAYERAKADITEAVAEALVAAPEQQGDESTRTPA